MQCDPQKYVSLCDGHMQHILSLYSFDMYSQGPLSILTFIIQIIIQILSFLAISSEADDLTPTKEQNQPN